MLRRIADPFALAMPLIALVNALDGAALRAAQVEPPLILSAERYGRLAASLGLPGLARLRFVDWPLLRRPLAAALAVATALSLGDLGVAAFFGIGQHSRPCRCFFISAWAPTAAPSPPPSRCCSAALVLALFLVGAEMVGRAACSKSLISRSIIRIFTPATR